MDSPGSGVQSSRWGSEGACGPRDGAVRVWCMCQQTHTHVHAAGAYWLRHTAVAHAIHMYCPVLCLVVPIHVPNYISHGVTVCLSSGTTIEATASCFMAFYKGTVHQFDSLMNERPLCVIKASTTGIVRWVMYSSHLCSHYNTYSAKPSVRHSQIRRVAFFFVNHCRRRLWKTHNPILDIIKYVCGLPCSPLVSDGWL